MNISVRDIHNYTVKPSKNSVLASVVGSVAQKLLMSDTTLRLFIPSQVRKVNTKLRQIC